MTTNSITERIRQNRLFVDDWSVYEKLLLASAVLKSGDQNWGSVSKMILNLLKSEKFVEKRRPNDWFTPKACNTQYQLLIETYAKDLPRRKKRDRNSSESTTETPVEFIVKQLWILRMEEIDKFSKLKFKEADELERLVRDAHHGRLSAPEIEAHYERLESTLVQEEKQAIQEYEELVRVREEKRKVIESKTSQFPGSVNTSLGYSSSVDEKSSSPTSPLLTSLLQSPSRSSTPIMSNLLISKLLETPSSPSPQPGQTSSLPASSLLVQTTSLPASNIQTSSLTASNLQTTLLPASNLQTTSLPTSNLQTTSLTASSLLQKELSKIVVSGESPTPSLVPLPDPSPTSIEALDEMKAGLPEDLAGVVVSGVDKSGEDGEEFEFGFDPTLFSMGKEDLEQTLNDKGLFEDLDIIPGRNNSVESDTVQEEVITLDLEEPTTVEEEVVLEEHIIQSVEEAMDTSQVSSTETTQMKTEAHPEPLHPPKPLSTSLEVKQQVQLAPETVNTEVKPEVKEVKVTAVTSEEDKVKPTSSPDAMEEVPSTTPIPTKPPAVSPTPAVTSTIPPPPPLKQKVPKVVADSTTKDRRKSSTETAPTLTASTAQELPPPAVKETRSLRASRESEKPASSDGGGPEHKVSRTASVERRERRRSRLGEDPSPVRERRSIQTSHSADSTGSAAASSPAKETRSSRLLREESSPGGKELRSLRSAAPETSSSVVGKELRPRGGGAGGRESEASPSPSPVPRSPRNSKELESSSPVKETRSKSRDEPPSGVPGKLKDSPAKEVKASRLNESTRKSLHDPSLSSRKSETPKKSAETSNKSLDISSKSPDTSNRSLDTSSKSVDNSNRSLDTSTSEIRRRLRSEPDFTGHMHESEDSSEGESSPELLEEMALHMMSSLPADVHEEFKAPLTASGRKRKLGDGRASPFLSDKEAKPMDPRAKKTLLQVYQTILTYKHASVFMKPVSDAQANNYSAIVRVQANLSGIKKRIESGAIRTVAQFQRSILLVFTNAMMYNSVNDALYKLAKETMIECNKNLQILVNAVPDSGGIEYNLTSGRARADTTVGDLAPGHSPHSGTERTKRSLTASPLLVATRKKKKGGEEEDEEGEDGGGRRGTKRAAAPSPRPLQNKKRKIK